MNIEIVKAVRYSEEPTIFYLQVSYLFPGTGANYFKMYENNM